MASDQQVGIVSLRSLLALSKQSQVSPLRHRSSRGIGATSAASDMYGKLHYIAFVLSRVAH